MMEGMDPKELEEMQRMQRKSGGDPSKLLANVLGGKAAEDDDNEGSGEEDS